MKGDPLGFPRSMLGFPLKGFFKGLGSRGRVLSTDAVFCKVVFKAKAPRGSDRVMWV